MTVEYTNEELNEFRALIELSGSRDQMDRITSRVDMPKFIKKTGKAKCDAMYKDLKNEWE